MNSHTSFLQKGQGISKRFTTQTLPNAAYYGRINAFDKYDPRCEYDCPKFVDLLAECGDPRPSAPAWRLSTRDTKTSSGPFIDEYFDWFQLDHDFIIDKDPQKQLRLRPTQNVNMDDSLRRIAIPNGVGKISAGKATILAPRTFQQAFGQEKKVHTKRMPTNYSTIQLPKTSDMQQVVIQKQSQKSPAKTNFISQNKLQFKKGEDKLKRCQSQVNNLNISKDKLDQVRPKTAKEGNKENRPINLSKQQTAVQNMSKTSIQKFLYEPPKHSTREIKEWEKQTGQKFYNLSPMSRKQANQQIQMSKSMLSEQPSSLDYSNRSMHF